MANQQYDVVQGVSAQGRELTRHGTALFPVGVYFDNLERDPVPWHWHDELEAVYIAQGGTVVSVGARHYTLQAGQGFFVNTGVLHACRQQKGTETCLYHSLVFHARLVGGGLDSVFWQKYLMPLLANRSCRSLALDGTQPWHAPALAAIEAAWQAGRAAEKGYEFRVRANLSELVLQLSAHMPRSRSQVSEKALRSGERVKQMLEFIEENYALPITAAEIAESAAVSESECLRCFHDVIGMPPMQYLKQFRIQRAARLLANTSQKISDIAGECGFLDNSYFTKTFREIKGMSPGEYRKSRGR